MPTYIIILAGYILLISTSGLIVNKTISRIAGESIQKKVGKETLDTGFLIGKCENILILTFMILEAYTAIALVFAAKTIIRSEDIKKNSLYFLAGTMLNVTYSVVLGLAVGIALNYL